MPPAENVSRAVLDVQRSFWLGPSALGVPSSFSSLEDLGYLLSRPTLVPFERRMVRWERVAGALLIAGGITAAASLLAGCALVALASAWAVTGEEDLLPTLIVVAATLGLSLALLFLWWVLTILVERRLDVLDARLSRSRQPERLRSLAWSVVRLDSLPGRVLVDDRLLSESLFREGCQAEVLSVALWKSFNGFDRQTVEVLARESGLSVAELYRAATLLG